LLVVLYRDKPHTHNLAVFSQLMTRLGISLHHLYNQLLFEGMWALADIPLHEVHLRMQGWLETDCFAQDFAVIHGRTPSL
jgi:hypothetical protein